MNRPEKNVRSDTFAAGYDYIVVGAGSAGCAVAAGLAEDPAVTVALLEAGPDDHHLSVWTPIGLAATVRKPGPRNYAYYTERQPGLDGRPSFQPRPAEGAASGPRAVSTRRARAACAHILPPYLRRHWHRLPAPRDGRLRPRGLARRTNARPPHAIGAAFRATRLRRGPATLRATTDAGGTRFRRFRDPVPRRAG
jgi:hypothetical protein